MSFEKYLTQKKTIALKGKYIKYNDLVNRISSPLTDEKEIEFKNELSNNFMKVYKHAEKEFNKLKDSEADMSNKLSFQTDLAMLSEFVKINIIGFKKVIKKHDKKSGFVLFKEFSNDFKEMISLLKKIDKLCEKKKKNIQIITNVEKYLIPTDYETFVQMSLNSKLQRDDGTESQWNFSVWLDNTNFESYFDLLHKNNNAEHIRLTWSGSSFPKIVTVEMETLFDKKSFSIASGDVLDFLNGKNIYGRVASANKQNVQTLYNEIHSIILNKKLRPIMKIFNNKMVFKSSDVTIAWKTGITAIKECSDRDLIENDFPLIRWLRSDANLENFDQLHEDEIVHFNQSILEISGNKPAWLDSLLQRNAKRVDDYNDYLHGAFLLNSGLGEIPYWIRMINHEMIIDMAENDSRVVTPINSKPIVIPVRVEPKVFFANERTFLSWVQFAIFLGGIGTAMLGMGDYTASICGIMLIIVASIFSIYSLCLFHWSAKRIREKHPAPYDDKYGIFVFYF